MTAVIYHNPRCSKSRQTLALLEEKGVGLTIVEYLHKPPSEAELRDILDKLGMSPRDLMRNKEAGEAGLEDETLSDKDLIAAMVRNPQVIERPIVVANGKARVGRPPESVLEIL